MDLLQNTQIPEWAKTKKGGIIYNDSCLNYRFDGMDGLFYLGSHVVGDYIDIRPFAFRWDTSERHGRKSQSWLDVAFLSPNKIVSVISFKKQSAVNIYCRLCQLQAQGIDYRSTVVTLKADTVEFLAVDDAGVYLDDYRAAIVSCVDFPSEKDALELQNFIDSGVFKWHLVGEV